MDIYEYQSLEDIGCSCQNTPAFMILKKSTISLAPNSRI